MATFEQDLLNLIDKGYLKIYVDLILFIEGVCMYRSGICRFNDNVCFDCEEQSLSNEHYHI